MKKDKKSVDERQQNILRMVLENGEVRSEEIAERFGISLMTVRRDLSYLEEKGHLRRTHGGAATLDEYYNSRRFNSEVSDCRDRISEFASTFVEDGGQIAMIILQIVFGGYAGIIPAQSIGERMGGLGDCPTVQIVIDEFQ